MTTTTPNLGLTLYDSSTDTSVLFSTFRAVWGGTAPTSNFYKIDTAYGVQASQIASLMNTRGAIPVSALFSSANYYVANGVSAITAYTAGMTIILNVDTTSNGTVTLNINSLGIISVMKVDSTGTPINLMGSDLVKGRQYLMVYDGARWLWVSANSADQIQIVGTPGNVVTVGATNNLDGSLTQSSLISNTLHAATVKTTLDDNDEFGISDSAASNILKKATWSNIKQYFLTGALATATNDFLVASGAGAFVKKTLAETKTILDVDKVVAIYTTNAGQSLAHSASTIINFGTLEVDTNAAVTTGAAWKFIAPMNGYYHVDAQIQFAATATWADGEIGALQLFVNGAIRARLSSKDNYGSSNSISMQLGGGTEVYLTAGDYIDIRVTQASGSSLALTTTSAYNRVAIVKT
jgi:hypothetical protein